MGLTSALYTGLSGINVNQVRIDAIGHNIANVNTTAFKGSRTLFQTQFSKMLSHGNGPSATSGGVNPTQLGRGALVGTIQRSFAPGSVETTGISSDLAIDGTGFFVLRRPDGQQVFTRDGAFSVNTDNRLVTIDGDLVQGFAVDENFEVQPGVLTDLTISLGTLSITAPTQNVALDGDLSADGTVATQGSETISQALVNGGAAPADAGTLLTDLRSATAPDVVLFADGDTLTVSGATKGDRALPTRTFLVGTDGSTLGDLAGWLQTAMGIQVVEGVPGNPGVTVENGTLVVRSNAGEQNGMTITANNVSTDSAITPLPFQFTQTASADGSGVYTGFTAYDSLGTPVTVNVTFALESTPDTGAVWRFYVESPDASGDVRALGTGTVTFDTQGNFLSVAGNQFPIDRSGTGAASPLTFTLDFAGIHGLSTQTSNVIMAEQDGFPPGTLSDFSVAEDGTINGTFSNGMSRKLGQVALAVFANPTGLIADTENAFLVGPNTGNALITAPGTAGAGRILSGALELSNVDLSNEFIGLITSSTGFQASSRVISVSSDLLDQLLLVVR
jgi:flagellar hook protein FlgE